MNTKKQNYSNHAHYVTSYHFATLAAMLFLMVGAVYHLFSGDNLYRLFPWMFFVAIATVISISFHCRSFALRAQDRAIRSEENLRHFIMTGKPLSSGLTLKQIIALRFASDEEFIELAERAVRENLTSREIKRSISNWRPDYHRA
jgi:hypothetical protein